MDVSSARDTPEDLAAHHRARHVERGQRPRVADVDPHQDRGTVQPEEERDQQAENGVDAEDREEGQPHPDAEGQGDAVRRVVQLQQLADPAA
jgi:hypothetical protein